MWQEIIALHSPQYRRKLLIQLGLNASVCVCHGVICCRQHPTSCYHIICVFISVRSGNFGCPQLCIMMGPSPPSSSPSRLSISDMCSYSFKICITTSSKWSYLADYSKQESMPYLLILKLIPLTSTNCQLTSNSFEVHH